jgi:hypothetical protein
MNADQETQIEELFLGALTGVHLRQAVVFPTC